MTTTSTETQTQLAAHLDPARKHDFAFLFDVRDGNPNGDPDAGGMPRLDPETMQGLVTDVAVKRKIRNMVALLGEGEPGYDIYVEAGVALNAQHERAYTALGLKPGPVKAADQEQARQWMCQTFFDVRMFGAVMTTGKALCGRVQGPVQITFSRSIDPVLPQEHGLTRVTQTRQDDIDKGESTEMGNKHAIPYGLYCGYGHFSAPLAKRTGVTTADLEMLWRAFMIAYSTTLLPAVRAVMSSASRIGTPEETSVPSVRVKRATADFRMSEPKTGTRRRARSIMTWPFSVL